MSVLVEKLSFSYNKDEGLQIGTLLIITVIHRCFLYFAIRLMVPCCKTHQIDQSFGQKTKCSITIYAFSYHIKSCISASLQLHFEIIIRLMIGYPPFIYGLYDE